MLLVHVSLTRDTRWVSLNVCSFAFTSLILQMYTHQFYQMYMLHHVARQIEHSRARHCLTCSWNISMIIHVSLLNSASWPQVACRYCFILFQTKQSKYIQILPTVLQYHVNFLAQAVGPKPRTNYSLCCGTSFQNEAASVRDNQKIDKNLSVQQID